MNNTLSPAEFSSYREMRQRFMWMEIKKKNNNTFILFKKPTCFNVAYIFGSVTPNNELQHNRELPTHSLAAVDHRVLLCGNNFPPKHM